MRRIDFDPNALGDDEWVKKATNLTAKLKAAPDAKTRKEILEANEIWKDIKPSLREISNGKCWYTEAKQEGTDVDVDHFRPKKRVAELLGSPDPNSGYWWLAFDPSNYRYSCVVANRRRRDVASGRTGGKSDHFPIWNEATRSSAPGGDLDAERPLLIDPCKQGEPELITFKEDGEAMPRFSDAEPYKYKKAATSIDLYSINHSEFVKARISLRDRIEELVDDAKRYYNRLETGDADHEAAYRKAICELSELRSRNSPYSAFSRSMTEKHRHEESLFGLFGG